MIVFRLSKSIYASDLSGKGAALAGGRWNSKGVPMIYTSASRSLCLAEVVVHISSGMLPEGFSMVTLDIPDDHIAILSAKALPQNWRETPAPLSNRQIGDVFCRDGRHLVLQTPSVVVTEEFNYMINPRHAGIGDVKVVEVKEFGFDLRFLK
jgi:RES domain-containing protein